MIEKSIYTHASSLDRDLQKFSKQDPAAEPLSAVHLARAQQTTRRRYSG